LATSPEIWLLLSLGAFRFGSVGPCLLALHRNEVAGYQNPMIGCGTVRTPPTPRGLPSVSSMEATAPFSKPMLSLPVSTLT